MEAPSAAMFNLPSGTIIKREFCRSRATGSSSNRYTKTSVKDKAVAAKKLEEAVLGKEKIVRMPPRKAS